MRTILTLIAILILSGCGGGIEDRVEDKIATKAENAIDSAVPDDEIEEVIDDIIIEDEDVNLSSEVKKFYNIELNKPPMNTWLVGLTDGDMTAYSIDDDYFDYVFAYAVDDSVLKVVLEKDFYNDDYGFSSKSAFDSFDAELKQDYNSTNEFDSCYGSDWMCGYENYSYSIYKSERVKMNFFENDDDIIAIELAPLGVYDITLKVTYQSKGWSEYLSQDEDNALSEI